MLENDLNLHVSERQKIRHYCARSTEEEEDGVENKKDKKKEEQQITMFYFMALLYTHMIENQL